MQKLLAKDNFWMPDIFNRSGVGEEVTPINERLQNKVNQVLKNNSAAVLECEKIKKIDNIVKKYTKGNA